jgi:hypothetical protein
MSQAFGAHLAMAGTSAGTSGGDLSLCNLSEGYFGMSPSGGDFSPRRWPAERPVKES